MTVHQAKDVTVFNLKKMGWRGHADYSIVCTGYSPRHLHKIGRLLLEEVKKLNCEQLKYTPHIAGRKEDEWLLIRIQDVVVNLFTQDYRDEIDIEQRYMDDPTQEDIEELQESLRLRKRATLTR